MEIGYPNGKKDEDILLCAQLIRIADAIDQKIKVYGDYSCTEIYNYLRLHKGREFNPDLWNAIMDLKNRDAGSFCIRISDNMSIQGIFSEIIQSVNPYWIRLKLLGIYRLLLDFIRNGTMARDILMD